MFQDFIFVVIFFLIPLVAYFILTSSKIKLFSFAPINIFLVFYWINAYIGILPLYFQWDAYRVTLGVVDKDIIFRMLIFSGFSIIIILFLVAFFLNSLPNYKYNKKPETQFIDQKLSGTLSSNESSWLVLTGALFLFCIFILFVYIRQIDSIPIITAIKSENTQEIALDRSKVGAEFTGKLHWYNLFMVEIAKFLMYYFIALILVSKKNKRLHFVFGFIAFIFCLFVSVMNANKVPVVYLVFSIILLFLIVRNKQLTPREIVIIFSIGMVLLLITYQLFFDRGRSMLSTIKNILSRMFTGSIAPAYFYLYLFPNYIPFLVGASFPNPGGFIPRDNYPITREIMNFMTSKINQDGGVVGSAPMAFWGEAYANYGILGIIFYSILVAFVLFLLTVFYYIVTGKIKLASNTIPLGKYRAWDLAYLVWLIFEIQKLTYSGISTILFNINLISITLLYFFGIAFLDNFFEKRAYSRVQR